MKKNINNRKRNDKKIMKDKNKKMINNRQEDWNHKQQSTWNGIEGRKKSRYDSEKIERNDGAVHKLNQ